MFDTDAASVSVLISSFPCGIMIPAAGVLSRTVPTTRHRPSMSRSPP